MAVETPIIPDPYRAFGQMLFVILTIKAEHGQLTGEGGSLRVVKAKKIPRNTPEGRAYRARLEELIQEHAPDILAYRKQRADGR